ncbi:MAG TPA: hypothetical protein DCP63_03255 [Bacteroidetes bacterium]|nr:hypothetical protein [Bacteroidota bacterium]
MSFDHQKIYVGMGGWDLEPFERVFYPPRPRKGFRKLEYYSQFFDSVEINSTFYNTSLSPDHARRWLQDVAANREFVFTVKLYQGFTHTFEATKQDVPAVQRLLEPIEEAGKLGGLLIQFPYSFTNIKERRLYVMRLAKVFQSHRLFVEVRHNSWNSPLMYNFFQENKLHPVNVDLPGIKQHMPLTCEAWGGVAYFRMMGRNVLTWDRPFKKHQGRRLFVSDRYRYLYNEQELEHLLYLIERLKLQAQKTFVVFHNDPEANSLVNGFQLRHAVRKRHRVLVPQNLVTAFPALKQISASVNVQHPLFTEVEGGVK